MKIEFEATLPTIKSAILFDGQEGAQAKLEIPELYIEQAIELVRMKGKVLRVTIEEIEEGEW